MVSDSITTYSKDGYCGRVLILVVMEYGLRQVRTFKRKEENMTSLNPCCNGIWSQTVILSLP